MRRSLCLEETADCARQRDAAEPFPAAITRGYLLLPYLQGGLDELCGLYAVINAIRFALADRIREFSTEDWQSLFSKLVVELEEDTGVAKAMVLGIEPALMRRLLNVALLHMRREHDIELCLQRPFKTNERPSVQQLVARLKHLSRAPQTALLFALRGYLDHWTVIRAVEKASLGLFDSSGFRRVSLSNCRMSYDKLCISRRQHILNVGSIFVVEPRMFI